MLYNATFKVKDDAAAADYSISVGLKDGNAKNLIDAQEEPVGVEFTSGAVTVGQAPVTPDNTTIVVGDVSQAKPGDTITVPVSVEANAGFAHTMFQIDYDHNALQLMDVVQSDEFPASTATETYLFMGAASTDKALIACTTNITDDINLFNLVFKVKDGAADGSTTVGLSIAPTDSFQDASQVDVPVSFVDGTITVQALQEINVPDDLTMPAFDHDSTWTRVYNGSPQAVDIGLGIGGGSGNVTVYYDGSTTAPTNVGSYEVSVTIDGVDGYMPVTTPMTVGTLEIVKAPAPSITWPTASHITYGQALSASNLSFLSNEYGSFAWDSSVDLSATPNAGTYEYPVVFTPNANTLQNYEAIDPLTQDVEVVVDKAAAPVISDWPTASTIRQGDTLASSVLSFTSNDYGTFTWTDATITPAWPGGDYELTFVPSGATSDNYEPIAVTTHNVHVTVVIPGDVSNTGYVSSLDVMLILQHAAGIITLQGDALLAADVNGDGSIDASDAVLAARIALGLD